MLKAKFFGIQINFNFISHSLRVNNLTKYFLSLNFIHKLVKIKHNLMVEFLTQKMEVIGLSNLLKSYVK